VKGQGGKEKGSHKQRDWESDFSAVWERKS